MADNVKSIKQRNEKVIDELISGFTFKDGVLTQNTYNDNFQKQKSYILLYAAKKKNSTVKEKENKSFGEKLSCHDNRTLIPNSTLYNELICHKKAYSIYA